MDERLRKALRLFAVFLKIGAFTFGGGYAMIPLIQKEITEKRGWMTDDDVLEIVAIAESTPGPIAVNAATFVGFRVCGFRGALLATLGVVLPSFLIIFGISFVLRAFQSVRLVQYAFNGIRAGVLALILKALWSMYRQCPKSAVSYVVMAAAFLMLMIPQLGQTMASWTPLMPYIFIALMLLAGYFLGKNLAAAHLKKIKQHVKVDLAEIPQIKQMLNRGWFFFQTGSDGMPKVFFHKTKTYNCLKPQRECGDGEEDDMLDNINI